MPRLKRHWLDTLADDLSEWMDREVEVMVEAFKEGNQAPFAAQITEADKLEFYRRAWFNPDGSPNEQGRQQTLARVGTEGYADIAKAFAQEAEKHQPRAMRREGAA